MLRVRVLLVLSLTISLTGCASKPSSSPLNPEDDYQEELLSILKETKSTDTFILTLELLKSEGADPHRVIPVAIRQGERLQILQSHIAKPDSPGAQMACQLADLLEEISKQKPQKSVASLGSALGASVGPCKGSGAGASVGGQIEQQEVAPIQPDNCEKIKQKLDKSKSDFRTPILPPLRQDAPPPPCKQPSEAEVLQTLPPVGKNMAPIYEEKRDNIRIVCEQLVDKVDPARFFPLVGVAQLRHCHWKCTVNFTQRMRTSWPLPCTWEQPQQKVVYLDKDVLHVYQSAASR